MARFDAVLQQLREERTLVKNQLESMDRAISILGGSTVAGSKPKKQSRRRMISAEGRRRIAEAQRRRWARLKSANRKPGKRSLSSAARRSIAAAQKARWARFRAAKKH